MAAQLIATNGPCARRLRVVKRARDQLLAGAALAGDQHGRVGVRHAVDQVEHLRIAGLDADDLLDRRAAPTSWRRRLTSSRSARCWTARCDGQTQHLDVERLGDEVVGAGADRGDRGLEAAEGGDHHHRHVGPVADDALAQGEPVHPVHVEVGDDDVEVLAVQEHERFVATRTPRGVVTHVAQRGFHRLAETLVIVDDQDSTLHGLGALRSTRAC